MTRLKVGKLLIALALVLGACTAPTSAEAPISTAAPQTLRLATTTSTDDSGLLDAILPDFESKYNTHVEVIAVGT
ncbi:MAG: ABC transporter permease, partial [Chloroflexota bacterium]